jgi:hypothetical protein
MTAVPKIPQVVWGGVVYEKCVTCVDPAARPVPAVTHASPVAMASGRSFLRMTLPPFLSDSFMPATEARNPRLRSGKITPRIRRVLESKADPRLVVAPWLSHCG